MKQDGALSAPICSPMGIQMNLKNQLRHYLDLKEMSASQLAKKASVPKQSLSGWLAGSSPRDVRQIKRVADALSISVDHLLFGKGNESPLENNLMLETIFGDQWMTGVFEVKLRRLKK